MASANYDKGPTLGEGTWGIVSLARVKTIPNLVVAIKKIKKRTEEELTGVNISAIREIKALRELKHQNIIKLHDVFSVDGILHLVLELCQFDLESIIKEKKNIVLSPSDVKSYMHMILQGIEHCHKNYVLHRGNIFSKVIPWYGLE